MGGLFPSLTAVCPQFFLDLPFRRRLRMHQHAASPFQWLILSLDIVARTGCSIFAQPVHPSFAPLGRSRYPPVTVSWCHDPHATNTSTTVRSGSGWISISEDEWEAKEAQEVAQVLKSHADEAMPKLRGEVPLLMPHSRWWTNSAEALQQSILTIVVFCLSLLFSLTV